MQGRIKDIYEKIVPYGARQNIKGYTRWRQYHVLRQGVNAEGYSLKPYDNLKAIFVHIPKTAGISVCQAFFGCLGGGHLTVRTYQVIFGPEIYDSYFKFAFVRNPWDRLVSAYFYLMKGGLNGQDNALAREYLDQFQDYNDFVRNGLTPDSIYRILHFIPQWEFVVDKNKKVCVDFIGKFETLENDFKQVSEKLEIVASLPKTNVSTRKDYRHYYDDVSAEVVASLYSRDIELFNYSFDDK